MNANNPVQGEATHARLPARSVRDFPSETPHAVTEQSPVTTPTYQDSLSFSSGEVEVEILGRTFRIHNGADPEALAKALAVLEQTFRDMERAYELRWGCPPSALDTSTWTLMGALNLAHQVVLKEQEASKHTQDLELTLTRLLDDVPDETLAPGALFEGQS